MVDTTYRVRATVFNVTGLLTFEYSTDSMATWNLIDTMTAKNGTDTVLWKIPNVLTTRAFVRVSNADGSRRDTSNARFSIVSEPPKTVRVLTPNGNQLYQVDSNAYIRWTSSNIPSGTFNIYYSVDSARTWKNVGNKAVQSGLDSIAWKIPNDTTSNGFVRVVWAGDTTIRDASDARFSIRSQIKPSITVIYPNGGESFKPDSVILIKWKAQDFNGNLTIQYSVDSMATWQNLGNRQVRQGVIDTLSWRVPNLPTTTAFVRVSQAVGGGGGGATAIRDTSDRAFIIEKLPDSLAPKITVTYPNGGEVLKADTTVIVSWNAERLNGTISVQYSVDNGVTWTNIANRQGRNGADTASWRVPNSPTTQALVRVGSATTTRDTSNATFTILARPDSLNPSLKLLYPNGGEVLQTDSTVTVSWESKNITGMVTIQYSVNGGQWKNVATQTTQEGPNGYRWKVPNDPSTAARMRVTAGGGGGGGAAIRDTSDAVFTIQSGPAPEVSLIEPRVGRRLVSGAKTWIVWTSLNTGGTLLLEYSLDARGTWKEIQAVQTIGGRDSLEWIVPEDTTTRGWVRLRTFDNATEYAIGPITILPAGTTGVEDAATGATTLASLAILPNPATDRAVVRWQQKNAGDVTAWLYASDGSNIATNQLGSRSAGEQQWEVNVGALPQGTYLLRLQSGNRWIEERIVVVR